MPSALLIFVLVRPPRLKASRTPGGNFFFSETALPKSFPSFPTTSVLAMFDQTGAPEGHPPGRAGTPILAVLRETRGTRETFQPLERVD